MRYFSVNLLYTRFKSEEVINIENVEKLEVKQLEKGVSVMKAPPNQNGVKNGDVYLYKLREMDNETIEKYGLMKYKERLINDRRE